MAIFSTWITILLFVSVSNSMYYKKTPWPPLPPTSSPTPGYISICDIASESEVILVVDNSCQLTTEQCEMQKIAIYEFLQEITFDTNYYGGNKNKITYVTYGANENLTRVEFAFLDADDAIDEYWPILSSDNKCCTTESNNEQQTYTDMVSGINLAIKQLRYDNPNSKIIVVNNNKNTNNICSNNDIHIDRNIDECNQQLICEEMEFDELIFAINLAFDTDENSVNEQYLNCLSENVCYQKVNQITNDGNDAYLQTFANCMPKICRVENQSGGWPAKKPAENQIVAGKTGSWPTENPTVSLFVTSKPTYFPSDVPIPMPTNQPTSYSEPFCCEEIGKMKGLNCKCYPNCGGSECNAGAQSGLGGGQYCGVTNVCCCEEEPDDCNADVVMDQQPGCEKY